MEQFTEAVPQFTPESWPATRWLDPASSYMRLVAVSLFMMIWQVLLPAHQNMYVPATADFHKNCACQNEKEIFPVFQDNRFFCYFVFGRLYEFTC